MAYSFCCTTSHGSYLSVSRWADIAEDLMDHRRATVDRLLVKSLNTGPRLTDISPACRCRKALQENKLSIHSGIPKHLLLLRSIRQGYFGSSLLYRPSPVDWDLTAFAASRLTAPILHSSLEPVTEARLSMGRMPQALSRDACPRAHRADLGRRLQVCIGGQSFPRAMEDIPHLAAPVPDSNCNSMSRVLCKPFFVCLSVATGQ